MPWVGAIFNNAMELTTMFGPIIVMVAVVAQSASTQVEWKVFPSAKGKYSVSMPSKPTEKKRVVAVAGKTLDLYTSTARKGLATYTASYADLAGAEVQS